jgi:hypothetical protein
MSKMLSGSRNPIRTALEKFAASQADARRRDCAQSMQTVPREWERAADYAAKAEAYDMLLNDLARECEKESSV